MSSSPTQSLSQKEVLSVLEHWRLRPLFLRPGGGTANASVIVVTPRGQYFLRRRNPRYSDPGQLVYDHSVMRALRQAGLPVPRVLRSLEGSRWVVHAGYVYELFEFLPGEPATPEDPTQICAAGALLGRFHQTTANLEPAGRKPWPRYFDPKVSLRLLREKREQWAAQRPAVSPEALETVDFLIAQAEQAAAELPDEAYWALPQVIVHGDWHPANMRFQGEEIVGLFDFDWVSRQPRMIDVADGLLFFGSRRAAPLDGADIWSLTQPFIPNWELMGLFLDAYRHYVALEPQELAALPALFRQRCLYMRVDAMARKVPPEDQLRFLVREIRPLFEWISAHAERLRRGW